MNPELSFALYCFVIVFQQEIEGGGSMLYPKYISIQFDWTDVL